jgi:catechol 2,3-dioxygenase-like lactoylglutathione lyase family enzyme
MITGVHALLYTKDADAARAFFRDILGFPSVDAGHGWLIFGLPAAELAAHPAEPAADGRYAQYLMCDDVRKTVAELQRKGVTFTGPITEQRWGLVTGLQVPGGGELGLYEPRHPVPPQAR